MLTPQEVVNQRFNRQRIGGYSMDEIDNFMRRITEDYATLYQDNTALKGKLKQYATKVDEYQRTEEHMRAAFLNAQNMAEQQLHEARNEARQIIEQATSSARSQTGDVEERVRREEVRLQNVKEQTIHFAAVIRELLQRQMTMLDAVPSDTEDESHIPRVEAETRLQKAAAEIERGFTHQLEQLRDTMSFGFVQGNGAPVAQDTEVISTVSALPEESAFSYAATESVTYTPEPVAEPVGYAPELAPNPEPIAYTSEPIIAPEPVTFTPEHTPSPGPFAYTQPVEVTPQPSVFDPVIPGVNAPVEEEKAMQDVTNIWGNVDVPGKDALHNTLTRLREMESTLAPQRKPHTQPTQSPPADSVFSMQQTPGQAADAVLQQLLRDGETAMANASDETTANLPSVNYDALDFGANYGLSN